MSDLASPAFQADDGGLGGFQLAEAAGFQTQTPVRVGDWTVVVGVDALVFAGSAPPAVDRPGDWLVEVVADAGVTFVPWAPGAPTAIWVPRRRRRQRARIDADALVVVDADARVRFVPAPVRVVRIPARVLVGSGPYVAASITARDYVRDVLLPEEEEVLALL